MACKMKVVGVPSESLNILVNPLECQQTILQLIREGKLRR
jgi:hypothetical protein